MRSTWSAVPARPTANSRSSVSGVATRVRARTLAYESSPRARAWASSGSVPRARYTDAFAGRAQVEPHSPAQPGSAGAKSGVPTFSSVELADEIQKSGGRGFEVCRQLGDLVTEPVQ